MKILFNVGILAILANSLFGATAGQNPDEANIISAQKREQILREYERLEAARSELESFRTATRKLFNERQAQLLAREAEVNKTLEIIMEKEANITEANKQSEARIAAMLEQNTKILDELKKGNSDKMLEAYVKMKEGKVAEVLGAMDPADAAKILYKMEAKKISAVLSKMDANKAVELTMLIKEGKIFDENSTKNSRNSTLKTAAQNLAPQNNANENPIPNDDLNITGATETNTHI